MEELVNKATGYMSTAEEPTLDGFLEEVALVADVDSLDESENRIVLMTLRKRSGISVCLFKRHGGRAVSEQHVYLFG